MVNPSVNINPPSDTGSRSLQRLDRFRALFLVAIFSLTLALLLATAITGKLPQTSGDVRSLFPSASPSLETLELIERLFGKMMLEVIVIAMPAADDFQNLDRLTELEERLGQLPGVEKVLSPLLGRSPIKPPLQLITSDNQHGRFLLNIAAGLSTARQQRLTHSIDSLLEEYQDLQPLRAGAFYGSLAVTKTVEHETQLLVPWSGLLLLIVLAVFLRSIVSSIKVMVAPALALLWVTLASSLCRISLGPVSQLAPATIMVIGASYSVYVATRILHDEPSARWTIVTQLIQPLLIATATTMLGFASLVFLNTTGVTEFAIMATMGTALAALFALTVTPFLLRNVARPNTQPLKRLVTVGGCNHLRHWLVFGILLSSAILSLGAFYIHVDTDPLDFLPANTNEGAAIRMVQTIFPGNHLLSLVIEKHDGPFDDDDFGILDRATQSLRQSRYVIAIPSIVEMLAIRQRTVEFLDLSLNRAPIEMMPWLSADRKVLRILVETGAEGRELLELRNRLIQDLTNTLVEQGYTPRYRVSASSVETVIAEQSSRIVYGIVGSLLSTALVVALLLYWHFRSWRFVIIGLIPNLVPVAAVFGTIGYCYGKMNVGAALVGSVTLGIAVDNTFHLMIGWQRLSRNYRHQEAVQLAVYESQWSFLTTTVVLVTGFSLMMISSVLPVEQFGFLLSVSLSIGTLADLIILPYLLAQFASSRQLV